MTTMKEILKEIEFLVSNDMSLTDFYNDLNKAVRTNNIQSIWKLSKIITRFHLDFDEFVDNKNIE